MILSGTQFSLFAQLPNWYFFRPSNNGSVIKFNPGPSLFSSSVPVFMDETGHTPIPNYFAVNAMYDDNGDALFYIVLTKRIGNLECYIYDKNGAIIYDKLGVIPYLSGTTLNTDFYPAREIPLISLGCGRHHAILGNDIIEINLVTNSWELLFPASPNPLNYLNVFGQNGQTYQTTALEIASINSTSYKIYSLIGNNPGYTGRYIRILEINYITNQVVNSVDYNFSTVTLPGTSIFVATNFTTCLSELEISPNAQKLAFAEDEYLFIFNLNSSGYINTTIPISNYFFYQNTISSQDYSIAGIEFTANSSSLVFSRFDPKITPTLTQEIAVWDFATSSIPNFISGTANYVRSQIELGLDNKIYTSSSTHLAEVTTTGTLAVNNILASNFDLNIDSNNCQIRILPDQISGHNYQVTSFEIQSYDVTNSGIWSPGVGNNPFNATSAISVLQKITIKSGVTLIIEDLTLNFFSNAEVIIEQGASLTVKHGILKSHSCGIMWKGINILDNGTTGGNFRVTNNSALQPSLIRDAVFGVKLNGPNSWLIVHGNTEFTANETDIKINNGNKNFIQIHQAKFNGGNVLRDQNKGSNYGLGDNYNRTTQQIWLENCSSQIEIGSLNLGACIFIYAEYGIKAYKSNAKIVNSNFSSQRRYGIHGDGQKNTRRNIDIFKNTFKEVQQPIRLENWVNSIIQKNELYGSKEWGIHYLENENCNLLIGDVNDPSNGNLLDFCNWVGIDLSANAGKNTNIIISNNSIINQTWATGIVISEYASIGISPTYNTLRIHKNTMNQIGAGIKLYNIEGWNGTYFGLGPRPHSNDFDANNLIDSNTINFTTVWEPHNQIGIQTTNSNKLNIHYNIVNSQDGGDWRNTGILTDDAYQTSIYKNICTGGSGIRIGGNMMLSNVYCNDLPNSFTGIFINYCYLRSVGDLHGILNSQARLNTFPSTLGGFDMRMYYSNNDLNQWVFNTSVPTIDYTFASGTLPTIDGGYGNNVCSPEPIIGTGETFQMKSVINNGTSKNTVTKSTILNPSLVNFKKPISKYGKINVIKSNLKNAKDSLAINTKRNDFAYRIAKVNELILNKKIDSALTILNNSNSLDSIENELLFVYRTLVNLQKSKKKLSPKQQEQIIEIARKNQYTQSIASPFARIIAKQELHLDIYDSLEFVPSIYGKINQNCTTPILEGLKVNLLTQTNKETGIFAITDSLGNFTINGLQLNSLNAQLNYKFSCLLPDSSFAFSLPTKIGSFMQMKLVDVVCQTILAKKKIQEGKAFIFTEPKVFPNPSNGKYIIEGAENSKLIVFNILGEIIYSEFVSSKTEINLSQYPKGIYFLNLVGEKQHSFKLILE